MIRQYKQAKDGSQNGSQNGSTVSANKAEIQKLELPHYTKYLLIAAYLASHNDAKIDKRLFVKNHGKQKKRLQNIRNNATVSKRILSFEFPFFNIFLWYFFRLIGIGKVFNSNRSKIVQYRSFDGYFLCHQ